MCAKCEKKEIKRRKYEEYRVAWKSKTTRKSGHGPWSSNREMLKDIMEERNTKYPYIKHWVETGGPIEEKKEVNDGKTKK